MKNKLKRLIHDWFGSTYANYFVVQRSVLQSMPEEWQARFVKCLDELEAKTDKLPGYKSEFWVRLKEGNRFIRDPYSDYQRGRRNVFNEKLLTDSYNKAQKSGMVQER